MNSYAQRAILGGYPPEFQPLGPIEALGNAGGFSDASLWRFDAPRGRLLLRGWPQDGTDLARVGRVHGWIGQAAERLPFVPTPIADRDGRTARVIGGRVWDLMPWMEGEAVVDRPWTDAQVVAGFAALAAFHARFWPEGRAESPGIATRLADVDRWLGGDLDAVAPRLKPVGSDPASDLARAWIDQVRREAPKLRDRLRLAASARVPMQLGLRDARPDHFLFRGDCLTGLVDYGAMGVDTVVGDLARLIGDRPPGCRPSTEAAITAYRSIRQLGDDELGLLPAFEGANALLGPGRWIRWHFLDRRGFGDPAAVVTRLRQLLDRLRS